MSWQGSRRNSQLTALGLPSPIKAQLIQEKARTGKSLTQLVCEALMGTWQSQGIMAPSLVPNVPAKYYVPPKVYPPQPPKPVGVTPPAGPVVGPAVVANPADQAIREVVSGGRYKGMVRQVVTARVPDWNM